MTVVTEQEETLGEAIRYVEGLAETNERNLGDLRRVVENMANTVTVLAEKKKRTDSARTPSPESQAIHRIEAQLGAQARQIDALALRIDALEAGEKAPAPSRGAPAAQADVALVLQPIVRLPERKATFFECFGLLRDAGGSFVEGKPALNRTLTSAQMRMLDDSIYPKALQLAERLVKREHPAGIIVNLGRQALEDGPFLARFIETVRHSRPYGARLIVEMRQCDIPYCERAIAALAQARIALSVDHMTDWSQRPAELQRRGFRTIKIRAAELIARAGSRTAGLVAALHKAGLVCIVERVETGEQLATIEQAGVRFAQGIAIAEPRIVS